MQRLLNNELVQWKNRDVRMPILLDGARQVGKTYLIEVIFGHTHLGGRVIKDDRKIRIKGSFISIWNTGGWIVPSRAFSPDACIFYIERNKDRLVPNMYKLVKVVKSDGKPPVGDYDKRILYFREKG